MHKYTRTLYNVGFYGTRPWGDTTLQSSVKFLYYFDNILKLLSEGLYGSKENFNFQIGIQKNINKINFSLRSETEKGNSLHIQRFTQCT